MDDEGNNRNANHSSNCDYDNNIIWTTMLVLMTKIDLGVVS